MKDKTKYNILNSVFLITIVLACVGIGRTIVKREKERRMDLSQFGYETGCLEHAVIFCPHLQEDKVNECREFSLVYCHDKALGFRAWLQ